MKAPPLLLLASVLAMIGGTAAWLAHLQNHQRLGRPGLRMIAENVLDETGRVVNTNTVALPAQVPGYASKAEPVSKAELSWLPGDTTFAKRSYQAPDGFEIQLAVVMMGTDRGSIHKPQICLTGQGWRIIRSETDEVPLSRAEGDRLPVMKLTASKTAELPGGKHLEMRAVYVYWFVADGYVTARHGQRMWWMARELLRSGTLQRWAYVSCFVTCQPGQEAATYDRVKSFIAASVPEFQLVRGRPGSLAGSP